MKNQRPLILRMPGRGWLAGFLLLGLSILSPLYGQWTELQKLAPADPASSFGRALAVSADGAVAVVGTFGRDESGSAYLYVRQSGGNWQPVQKLTSPPSAAAPHFGEAIAVSADGAVVAVAAPGYGLIRDKVYLYERIAADAWEQKVIFLGPENDPGQNYYPFYATSLAISPAGDRLVVGASEENYVDSLSGALAQYAGAAYLYRRGSGGWNGYTTEKLHAPDPDAYASFGQSVAITDTVVLIGAFRDDDRAEDAGAVYVFRLHEVAGVEVVQKLTASDAQAEARFGDRIDLSGRDALIAGRGSAYVFIADDTDGWQEVQRLSASDGSSPDFTGGVSLADDLLVTGSLRDNEVAQSAGAAFAFARTAQGLWQEVQKLKASDGQAGDVFGSATAVSASGDLVFVGAPGHQPSGAVYIFHPTAPPGSRVTHFRLTNEAGQTVDPYLLDTDSINRFSLSNGRFNLEAVTLAQGGQIGSVRLDLSGEAELAHIDNTYPFELFSAGAGQLPAGDYVLTATPFPEPDAAGTAGGPLTVHFTVIAPQVVRLRLVDAAGEVLVDSLHDGIIIDLDQFPAGTTYHVEALTHPSPLNGYVNFELYGTLDAKQIARAAPYRLFANGAQALPTGTYQLGVAPFQYVGPEGFARVGAGMTITFTLTRAPTQDQWVEIQRLRPPDGPAGAGFGNHLLVSTSADVVVVTAPWQQNPGNYPGALYIYSRGADGTWQQVQQLLPPPGAALYGFGEPAALSADGGVLVVSGTLADRSRKLVYIYERGADGRWTYTNTLQGDDPSFGSAVAVTPSGGAILVGAPNEPVEDYLHGYPVTYEEAGAVYRFTRSGAGWSSYTTDKFIELDEEGRIDATPYANYGTSVAVQEGWTFIGAPGTGTVHAYPGLSFTGDVQKIRGYGIRVGLWGTRALIGTTLFQHYNLESWQDSWRPVQRLITTDGTQVEFIDARLAGDYVLLGAPFRDEAGDASGAAYLFEGRGIWREVQKLVPADAMAGDHFGWSVALPASGEFLFIGAKRDDQAGSVYVYQRGAAAVGQVLGLRLVDTAGQVVDADLVSGDTISRSWFEGGAFHIEAVVSASGGELGSVKFELSGDTIAATIDNVSPFRLFGNDAAPTLSVGQYTLKATPYSEANAGGLAGQPLTVSFKVVTDPVIRYLRLLSETGEVLIDSLPAHTILNLEDYPAGAAFNIQAVADTLLPGSVRLALDGPLSSTRTTNLMPYDVFAGGARPLPPGAYTITAESFQLSDGGGRTSRTLVVQLVVVWGQTGLLEKLTAHDAHEGDLFGWSVAVAESGEVAVVGAPGDDERGPETGAAYVFVRRPDGGWQQVQKLTYTSNGLEEFGRSVAISANGDHILVAAPGAYVYLVDNEGTHAFRGEVFLFGRGGDGRWNFRTSFSTYASFTRAIAISPGGDHLLLGAEEGNQRAGVVFEVTDLFFGDISTSYSVSRVIYAGIRGSDRFGTSLALTDDFALFGAPEDDEKAAQAGAAYLVARPPTSFSQKLTASDARPGAYFGRSSALTEGVALIGAPEDDAPREQSGSAYVFEPGADGKWQEVQKLTASDAAASMHFGGYLAVRPGVAVVGVPEDDDRGTEAGAAYVFVRQPEGLWQEVHKLTALDAEAGDAFGRAVALSPDGEVIFVGAPYADNQAENSGAVYLFSQEDFVENHIAKFQLVNAAREVLDADLADGDTIDLNETGDIPFNIQAIGAFGAVGSVRLALTGPRTVDGIENLVPYEVFSGGASRLPTGTYTLTATPYSRPRGAGRAGMLLTIRFTVTREPAVRHLRLVNAAREVLIDSLTDGTVINLNDYPAGTTFNIQAIVDPAQAGSVRFDLNGPLNRMQSESQPPYYLFGKRARALRHGTYQLTVQAFRGRQLTGVAGEPLAVHFTVIRPQGLSAGVSEIPSTPPAADLPLLQLQLYPNPTLGSATLVVEGTAVGTVHTRLIDLNGKVIREWQTDKDGTSLILPLELSGLPAGVYEVQAVVGAARASVRVAKGR